MSFRYIVPALIVFVSLAVNESVAQARRSASTPALEQLPRYPLDTIATPDPETKVILYSNNTWSYHRPYLNRFDSLPVFCENWDTTQVFSYRSIELNDLPQITDIKLISSFDEFCPPITGKVFSKYGPRGRRNHNGVDIPLKTGEPIYATFDGKVRYSKYNSGGFGNLVIIRHPNGLETWYAHLTKRNVGSEEYVRAGQVIGYGGSTGRSRGPHLHFEMRYCDQTFDPERLLDFETGQLKYQTFALEKSYFNIRSRASDQLEDHDAFEEYAFAAPGEEGGELTSEEIIRRIENGGATRAASSAASTASTGSGDAMYHTIVNGDILGKIARRYGVSVGQICRLNNMRETDVLRLGRKLRVR